MVLASRSEEELAALAPGGSGWIKIDLEPGTYAAFNFLLDQRTGKSQLASGMIIQFTVHERKECYV